MYWLAREKEWKSERERDRKKGLKIERKKDRKRVLGRVKDRQERVLIRVEGIEFWK